MKLNSLTTIFTATAIALGTAATFQQPSNALPASPELSTNYVCLGSGTPGNPYKTVAQVFNRGGSKVDEVSIIRWNRGSLGGYTPSERCQDVSNNFNRLSAAGHAFLRSGRLNGSRVICLVANRNDSCTSSTRLFTLRPGDGAELAISRLANLGQSRAVGPLNESSASDEDITIDLNEYIRQQAAQMN